MRSRLAVRSAALAVAAILVGSAAAEVVTAPGKNGRIAFRRYLDAGRTWGAVFVANPDGSQERQVTRPARGSNDDQPDWSPNGSLLLYHRCLGRCQIHTVRPDGTGAKELTSPTGSDDSHASFTPNGRQIIFTRAWGGIRTYPGGDQIRYSEIVVMDLNGKNRRVLLRAPEYQADYEWATFAPNGSQFVYEHRRSYFADRQTRRALVVSSADGKRRKRITPWSMNAGDGPDWSPNGKLILFRSNEDENEATQSQLYTIRPDGTGLKRLTNLPAGTLLLSATFSPDGKQIVFSKAGKNGNADLFTMLADGTSERPVTNTTLWDSAPDWGPKP